MDLNSILTTNYSSISSNRLKDSVITETSNECFFIESLEFIKEFKSEMRTNIGTFYKSLLESQSEQAITESFSDLYQSFKNLIGKFLKFIRSLFDRFILKLNQLVKSDKYIEKHKDDLNKFKSDYEFDIQGYNYTFSSAIPVIEAKAKFDKEFVKLQLTGDNIKNSDAVLKHVTTLYDNLSDNLQDILDEFRAECIGQSGRIDSSDFAQELFKVFRDGDDTKSAITVTADFVNSSYASFRNYKEYQKSVKKTKDKIEKDYEQVKKSIERLVHRDTAKGPNDTIRLIIGDDYDGYENGDIYVNNETRNKIDLYIKAVCDLVLDYSTIHSMAFSAKLDAIKDRYIQDKKVLYTALNKIYKLERKEDK